MSENYGKNWQDRNEAAIPALAKPALSNNESILNSIGADLESPLRMFATFPTNDSKLNFSLSPTTMGDGGKKALPPIDEKVFTGAAAWVDFQLATNGGGFTFDVTWPTGSTLNYYRYMAAMMLDTGVIKLNFSNEAATIVSLSEVGALFDDGVPLGYVLLQCTDAANNYFKSADEATPIIVNSTIYRFGSGAGGGSGSAYTKFTKEPTGIYDRILSKMSISGGAFTMDVVTPGVPFYVFVKGKKFQKLLPETVTPSPLVAGGRYYFYYDDTGTLTYQTAFDDSLIKTKAWATLLFWNGTKYVRKFDERHGIVMDAETHSELHNAIGMYLRSGFNQFSSVINVGAPSGNHSQYIQISSGTVSDEDITIPVVPNFNPAITDLFNQDLGGQVLIAVGGVAGATITFQSPHYLDAGERVIFYDTSGAYVGEETVLTVDSPTQITMNGAVGGLVDTDYLMKFAKLPVVYFSGVSKQVEIWENNLHNYAFFYGVTVGDTDNNDFPYWNENNLGTWQMTQGVAGDFLVYWVIASNDWNAPIYLLPAKAAYATLATAQASETLGAIDFGDLPGKENKVLYRLIYQLSNAYTNSQHRCKIVEVTDFRSVYSAPVVASGTSGQHSAMSGLAYDQAGHTGFQRQTYTTTTNPTNNNDAVDTAGSGIVFSRGALWFNSVSRRLFFCENNAATLAVWTDVYNTFVHSNVASMKAVLGHKDNDQAYCVATETIYRYEALDYASVVSDDKTVIDVTADANARWIAVAGKYNYFVPGYVYSTVAAMKAVTTGLNDILGYCVETETYYRYEALDYAAIPGNDLSLLDVTADANARWLGVAGRYAYLSSGGVSDVTSRIQIFLDRSNYKEVTTIVFSEDQNNKTDLINSTGLNVGDSYQMTVGQIFQSLDLLSLDTFLTEEQEITQVDATLFYKLSDIDTAPVVEVTRDGGLNWQTMSVEEESGTDLWHGSHIFTDEVDVTLDEYANGTGTPALAELDDTTYQKFATKFVTTVHNVYKQLELYISKANSPVGKMSFSFVRDDSGAPSSDGADIVSTVWVDITTLSIGLNTVTLPIPTSVRVPGTYWIVVQTDDEYRGSFVAGTSISLRGDSSVNGNTLSYDGATWSAYATMDGYYKTLGRVLDLRVRVTAGATSKLRGLGVYYGEDFKLVADAIDVADFQFSGDLDQTTFTLPFLPNPTMLRMADAYEGKVYHGRTLTYDGYDVLVPTGFFDRPGMPCRAIFWHEGAAFDTTDANALSIQNTSNKLNKVCTYTVGAGCDYPDLWTAFSMAVDGDTILVTENQSTTINRQLVGKKVKIIFKVGVKVICITALPATSIITFGDDIVTENFAVESQIVAGTTSCGIEMNGDRSFHTNLQMIQNGVGGTITDAIKINLNKGGNYAAAMVRQQAGTITNDLMDNSLVTTNDVTVRGLTA